MSHRLSRFLVPSSVAVVGASERQARSNNAVEAMRQAGQKLYFVNSARDEVYGERAYPDLESIGGPVDAVLSLVPAAAVPGVVRGARAVGAGGVVVVAGGFAESGAEGRALEAELLEAAGDLPVLGPNCNGFIRPSAGARLSGAPLLPFPEGNLGVVTHSGALLGVLGLAAAERGLGYSTLVSTGNEMTVDMADCLEFLAEDDETSCILLVLETIRSPERFFRAARRALRNGKPIVALKLGRSERGRDIASSHTGALVGQSWVYDAALAQHGIAVASDVVDLLDRVSLLSQLPRERWTEASGVAVASLSGGWATMASDVCDDERVSLPALGALSDEVNRWIPDRTTVNPLDMTGFAMGRSDVVEGILASFATSPEVDAIVLQWFLDESTGEAGRAFVDAALRTASEHSLPVVLGSVEDGHPGDWARALPAQGVALGRGLRGTVRALRTMGDHVRFVRAPEDPPSERPALLPRPEGAVSSEAGAMLGFGPAMALLETHGVPVAAYHLVAEGESAIAPGFDGPYVVKLADVPHRTELDGVRLGVRGDELSDVVADLRAVARRREVSGAVVIQQQLTVCGEAFVGVQRDSGLGPLVVAGVGGIFVEVLKKIAGRIVPVTGRDAEAMIEEIATSGVIDGARGRQVWPRDELASVIASVGRLAESSPWLSSLDINPLVLTPGGFVAVDALALVDGDEGEGE